MEFTLTVFKRRRCQLALVIAISFVAWLIAVFMYIFFRADDLWSLDNNPRKRSSQNRNSNTKTNARSTIHDAPKLHIDTSQFGQFAIPTHLHVTQQAISLYNKASSSNFKDQTFLSLSKLNLSNLIQDYTKSHPLWHVNWEFFVSNLINTSNSSFSERITINTTNIESSYQFLQSIINWQNRQYNGYCRPYFYPYVAFINEPEINFHIENRYSKIKTKIQWENSLLHNPFYWINKKINKCNTIDADAACNIYDLFNTSNLRKDLERVKYFQEFETQWRFDSVVIMADSLEKSIVSMMDYDSAKNEKLFRDTSMVIEIVVSQNHFNKHLRSQRRRTNKNEMGDDRFDVSRENNQFLCVFNDGTVVLSKKLRFNGGYVYGFVIECDISDYLPLKYKIYKNVYFKMQQQTQKTDYKHTFSTNIGLTLFSLHSKQSVNELLNEFAISMNIQLPVCGYLEINRKSKIYSSEMDYNQHNISNDHVTQNTDEDGLTLPKMHTNIRFTDDGILLNNKKQQGNYKYLISGTNTVHPRSRMNEMDIMTQQWIDYHLFQGFEHFYLYDHLYNRDNNDIEFFYHVLKKYISQGYATLIEWPMCTRADELPFYQFGAFMDSVRRFGDETKYIYLGDVDEYLIPKPLKQNINDAKTLITSRRLQFNATHEQMSQKRSRRRRMFARYNEAKNKQFRDVLFDTNKLFSDEYIVPTVRDIIDALFECDDCSYNAFRILDYPGLPSVYNLWNGISIPQNQITSLKDQSTVLVSTESKIHQLGCDRKNPSNIYDTFFQRHSCLHHVVKSHNEMENIINQIKMTDIKPEIDEQIANMSEVQIIEYLTKVDKNNFDPNDKKMELKRMRMRIGEIEMDEYVLRFTKLHEYLTDTRWAASYELKPKIFIQTKTFFLGFQHTAFLSRNNQFNFRFWDSKQVYDMFILHTSDHWRALENCDFMNFESLIDVKYFYSITQNECDFENLILYWNKLFLKSEFGKKWINNGKVKPLIDTDGMFCYLKNPNYTNVWQTGAKRLTKRYKIIET